MTNIKKTWEIAKKVIENKLAGKPYQKYLVPEEFKSKSVNELMAKMLLHAQNNAQKRNSIKFEKFIDKYKVALYGFEPKQIVNMSESDILDRLIDNIPNYTENNGFCKNYVRVIKEVANFLLPYKNSDEFIIHCKNADKKDLPKEIQKVYWFGKALSLDFLKELGFECYAKPDVHIKDFISTVFGCKHTYNKVIAKINEISEKTGETQFAIDKLIYLACSHNFYMKGDEAFSDSKGRGNNTRRLELIKEIQALLNN